MVEGIQLKVCGLTSLVDAECADACGADFLGFILHEASPRRVSLAQYQSMSARLPARRRVAVVVEPGADVLGALRDSGFDRYQVHFRHDVGTPAIEAWSAAVGPENLWLAPKLPPGEDVPRAWLGHAGAVLLDTFDPNLFGGTGRTGDWAKFRRHREAHPAKAWILSGGLRPENIADALAGTGARFVDVNSGVESAPGVKDPARIRAFAAALRAAPKAG
jgi:phosphoribosylanthranilate isomerase